MSAWLLVLLARLATLVPMPWPAVYAELRAPGTRAMAEGSTGDVADLRIVYRGPTRQSAPLASGELRRQIGLKLRARDTCNVLYVMWHLAPTTGIRVSLKSNPGLSSHADCADRGYVSLTPSFRRDVAPLEPGVPRTLTASIADGHLRVAVDGAPAWRGELPEAAHATRGLAGLRSDNGEFDVWLKTDRRSVTPVRLRFTTGAPTQAH